MAEMTSKEKAANQIEVLETAKLRRQEEAARYSPAAIQKDIESWDKRIVELQAEVDKP